jgi:mannitol/fructose-specific phosphotransferase system IIA component (Ntr-type)
VTYASARVVREGAIYHLFERLGRRRYGGLDRELRGILKEKGLRSEDPFDEVVGRSHVIDAPDGTGFLALLEEVAPLLAARVGSSAESLREGFLQGTRIGATPVTHGVALPHLRLAGLEHPEMVLVRARAGVDVPVEDEALTLHHPDGNHRVYALFFLVSPEDDPARHLRLLAQLAERVDADSFHEEWRKARDEQRLKEVLLRDERFLSLSIGREGPTARLDGLTLRELHLPEGSLVAVVRRRGGEILVPSGGTRLAEGDRVTIIGTPERIRELAARYES